MSGGRALGIGLLGGAAVLTALLLLWLAVSGASSGGIVLGLVLVAVLAGPLAGAGWYVLSRQPTEALEAAQFASKRRVLDADRVFRREIGAALRTVADRPDVPRARVLQLASAVEGARADSDSVQLDDSEVETLGRYDDLVWQRVRRLRDDAAPGDVDAVLMELQRALDQRTDLLLRGRHAPEMAAAAVLTSEARSPDSANVADVAVGWAVSRGQDDYVVEGVASYFADGQTWKLAHLVPTSGAARPAWLYVGPAATPVALLDELAIPVERSDALVVEGDSLPRVSSGTAVADVVGGSGTAQGVLVAYHRYQAGPRLALVEDWPDGQARAYAGRTIGSTDLELWPAETPSRRPGRN
jgi:hypothetical protein